MCFQFSTISFFGRSTELEIDRTQDNIESTIVSEEDSGWFLDSKVSLSSSDSNDDGLIGLIRERVKVRLNFLILGKGEWQCEEKWVTFPKLDIGGDQDNDSERDDNDGDGGYDSVHMIVKSWLFTVSFKTEYN